jgi:hypothetical protein
VKLFFNFKLTLFAINNTLYIQTDKQQVITNKPKPNQIKHALFLLSSSSSLPPPLVSLATITKPNTSVGKVINGKELTTIKYNIPPFHSMTH